MKLTLRPVVCAFALLLSCAAVRLPAQASSPMPVSPLPPGIAQSFATLADQPSSRTGFVFDRTMMEVARGVLEAGGLDSSHAAAALYSISVDTYHYPQPAFYTPEAMASLRAAYQAAGWKHLVNAHDATANPAQPRGIMTDLWLHFTGSSIDGLTVLARGQRDMNVIQVGCDLRPLDLVHLSGHFGIPKVDPNAVMVPAPNGR